MNLLRKTKIICTIGPACDSEVMLRSMIEAGMNVARLNFSHGTHASHKVNIDRIKKIRQEMGVPVALLLDTKGPEVRTGAFPQVVMLEEGTSVVIRHDDIEGNAQEFSCSYKNLARDLHPGSMVLIDDGLVEMRVESIRGLDVHCRVMNGGPVSSHKSINLPETELGLPALTERDVEDIRFAVENDMDFIAASFIRKAQDVLDIKQLLDKLGGQAINVIAKIENREGVNNFEDILKVADGIMVARGDLGVEIPTHEVPSIQKRLIRSCYREGKPCITATQMLDSMIRNPRPTRAEASDVANAILDGTSTIMLSGETAAGKYPLEAVAMMDKIASYTEEHSNYWAEFEKQKLPVSLSVANAVSHACCLTAKDLKAKAIIAVTHSGRTARLLSRFRPASPIIATTVSVKAFYQLALSWGVIPYIVDEKSNTDEVFEVAKNKALESGLVSNGDIVVISGGTPVGMSGTTNTLKVQNIGRLLCQGKVIGRGQISGESLVITHDQAAPAPKQDSYILVMERTNNEVLGLIKKAKALIVEDPDRNSHAVTVAMALDIPVVYACENATRILKNGAIVTIDCHSGTVS